MRLLKLINYFVLTLFSINIYAVTIDGSIVIGGGEYQWSTDGAEGSAKWMTHEHNYPNDPDGDDYANGNNQEYDDGSTGDPWDINYLGTDISDNKFQFGARGGEILSGSYNTYTLSDFAISVRGYTDPTLDSSGFEYAIRLLGVGNGAAEFELFQTDNDSFWETKNIYNRASGTGHQTETFKLQDGTSLGTFLGKWSDLGEMIMY